jgi:hypothetical protein
VLEDVAFVTPGESGADGYAASLRYRIDAYRPGGELADSWTFTGYGAAESGALSSGTKALQAALNLAMRDAAAKLVAEFREQALARGLLPEDAEPPPPPAEIAQPPP